MPKKLPENLCERLLATIRDHPDGISASQLAVGFHTEASARSLGRRLRSLTLAGRILAKGGGRGTRYFPPTQSSEASDNASASSPAAEAVGEAYVPLSEEGRQVRELVRRPAMDRPLVGYERGFLDAYRPNETYYLEPSTLREHLHAQGRVQPAGRPAGTFARDVLDRLLIDLSWASSRLEGNTYTRLDTQQLVEFGKAAEGKDARETQMILNHKQAIEFLVENAADIRFDTFTFFNLHALLSENLLGDPGASGRIRSNIVEIGGTTYHPLAMPQLIDELFRTILAKAGAIRDPFEQAFFLLVHIPYLQPFQDVNKRVSRLGANIPLIKANLCPLSFVDVPERAYVEGTLGVYELRRVELLRDVFEWAYGRSCQRYRVVADSLPEPDPIRLKYREALREIISGVVRDRLVPDPQALERLATGLVPQSDLPGVVRIALEDLRDLHEGNIARYRIRLSEFKVWQERMGS